MTRNLKVLGIALTAAVALSVMAASGAQATNGILTTGATPATHTAASLTGVPYAKVGGPGFVTENYYEAFGIKMSCTNMGGTQSSTGTDKSGILTPTASHCGLINSKDELKPPLTVNTNGCSYEITQPVKLTTNEYTSKIDLVCPSKGIAVHQAAGGTYTSHIGNICTLEVTPGQEIGHVVLHNKSDKAKDYLTGTVNFTNIHMTQSGACGAKTENGVRMVGNLSISSVGETHDVWISDEE